MKPIVDLSHHNGDINFEILKDNISGAILRAGYGNGNLDRKFREYASECNRIGIPIGIYWFSYAYTQGMAIDEAKACANVIGDFKVDMPVFFDWEQDSWDNAVKRCVAPTQPLITALNRVFCETIQELGYDPGVYFNEEYRKRYLDFSELPYKKWYARYRDSITVECDLWQYASDGNVPGISGRVDMNKLLNESLLTETAPVVTPAHKTNREVAEEVINGEWGNGEERKERLSAAGYDYDKIQKAVNELMNKKKTTAEIAQEVIDGKWGNGQERKDRLKAAGYNPNTIQKMVNKLLK